LTDDGLYLALNLVRGSIPLIWTQYANLKYTPEIKFLTDKQKQRNAFSSHFNTLNEMYQSPLICVNLCKEKGQEKKLSDVYEAFYKNVQFKFGVKYVAWDFHKEVKHTDFTKVNILLNRVQDDMRGISYYAEQYTEMSMAAEAFIAEQSGAAASSGSKIKKSASSDNFLLGDAEFSKDAVHENEEELDDNLMEFDDKAAAAAAPQQTVSQQVPAENLLDFDSKPSTPAPTVTVQPPASPAKQPSPAIVPAPSPAKNSQLLTPISAPLVKGSKGSSLSMQKGTFRINCIDCCDRTNVTMTYIAKTILRQQMLRIGILLSKHESLSEHKKFEEVFNHVWANNGDKISLMYSGTGALMGDYTRTGQRSVSGLLSDGFNSVSRYVQNNFKDSVRQRSINLVLGILDINSKDELQAFQGNDIVSELFLF